MIQNIDVVCLIKQDSSVTPLQIIWHDGRKFDVDRVLDVRRVASTKGGGKGIRYTCRIMGKQKYLFLDGYHWFVEVDAPSGVNPNGEQAANN